MQCAQWEGTSTVGTHNMAGCTQPNEGLERWVTHPALWVRSHSKPCVCMLFLPAQRRPELGIGVEPKRRQVEADGAGEQHGHLHVCKARMGAHTAA